jgi:hypothetical protein
MKKLVIPFLGFIIFTGCKKKCIETGQFDVPLYIQVTNVPSLKLLSDTITVTASVPYNTSDLRIPSIKLSTERYKPSTCYFTMSAILSVGGSMTIPPIIPFQDGYFDVLEVKGKRLRNLYFDFEPTDTAWVVCFKLIPKRTFNGLFYIGWSPIQYKDDCIQIDPKIILINTPLSHHLIAERLDFPLFPYPDDVFFYVE